MRIIELYRELTRFTAQQSTGFKILCVILFISVSFRVSLPIFYPEPSSEFLDSLVQLTVVKNQTLRVNWKDSTHLFSPFDPNTVSDSLLHELGFSDKYVDNLLKYRSKGGRINQGNDLFRIYGADSALISVLISYVYIENNNINIRKQKINCEQQVFSFNPNRLCRDSFSLLGFDQYYIDNLLKYRNKKGTFKSHQDLLKIFGADTSLIMELEKFIHIERSNALEKPIDSELLIEKSLFLFDPNSICVDSLLMLGFTPKQSKTFINYRSHGAKFYKPSDLYQVYGLDSSFVLKLIPFVDIDSTNFSSQFDLVDINVADSLILLTISGIGPTFSSRILERRKKLGGFYSCMQLSEIYGLNEKNLSKIIPQVNIVDSSRHMININFCTKEELSKHPYVYWRESDAFVRYRSSNGMIHSLDDISRTGIFSEWEKLKHYIYCHD